MFTLFVTTSVDLFYICKKVYRNRTPTVRFRTVFEKQKIINATYTIF